MNFLLSKKKYDEMIKIMRTILCISLKNELKTHVLIWRFLSKIWNLLVALITIKTNCMKLKTKRLLYSREKNLFDIGGKLLQGF